MFQLSEPLIATPGSGKISSAARKDFAKEAAAMLNDKSYKGKVLELPDETIYTLGELATENSKQTGKDVFYKNLPEEEDAKIIEQFKIPKEIAAEVASWGVNASKGDMDKET